jgi:hypothetical protein
VQPDQDRADRAGTTPFAFFEPQDDDGEFSQS